MSRFTLYDARRLLATLGVKPEAFSLSEFLMGLNEEWEEHHTTLGDDEKKTAETVMAHLTKIPDYYTRLARMEDEAKRSPVLKWGA